METVYQHSQPTIITYTANRTFQKFHPSDAMVRAVMGPRGSGKSTGCCWEIMRRAAKQKKAPDGKRYFRAVVVRNTYPELRDTTLKTWLYLFKEDIFGRFNHHDMAHRIKYGDLDMEILFRALDTPDDIKKLLSLEVTMAWVNEARQIYSRSIISGLRDTIGRYPPMKDGGPTWSGLILDTNPPDTDHWWYKIFEEEKPEGWMMWRQPGGLVEREDKFFANPEADNLENLKGGSEYYIQNSLGASKDHIRVYYCGQYGFVQDGRPVYPEYFDNLHCPTEELKPVPGLPIYVGLDFGLTPAALFSQRMANGSWIWFDELVTDDMGIEAFSKLLKPKLALLKDFKLNIFGDPAGNTRTQTDEKTCYQILEGQGIQANQAPSNVFTLRREAVASALKRLIDGKPGLLISPKCKVARKAMAGGYCFRRLQVSGQERFHDEPSKNHYSHVAEAGQYAMLGAGEGEVIINFERPKMLQGYTNKSRQYGRDSWML